jgi:hypothetical protein
MAEPSDGDSRGAGGPTPPRFQAIMVLVSSFQRGICDGEPSYVGSGGCQKYTSETPIGRGGP